MNTNHAMTNGAPTNGQLAMRDGKPPMIKKKIKKNAANPFGTARQAGTLTLPNGQKASLQSNVNAGSALPQKGAPGVKSDPNSNLYSGFSDPAIRTGQKQYTDYKLVATKKELLEGLRFHVMHLTGEKVIDIRNPGQFAPPAHLHRRDPRAVAPEAKDDDERIDLKDGLNEEERQALKDRNEARKVERAANLAQIAPTQASRKNQPTKLKTKAVMQREWTSEEKERIRTNYEEKLPWLLEDFDNKHCFVGKNQAPSTKRHVALAYESAANSQASKFRLIPVEKVYDFEPRRKAQIESTLEEAEAKMRARAPISEWNQGVQNRALLRRQQEILNRGPKVFTGENKDHRIANRDGEDADLDFGDDDDVFADDEDGDTLRVKDEEEELLEKKIKADQLKANFFELKDEAEYDYESDKEKREEDERKENFRRVRKALEKHEHNYQYGSDSEYSSSSEDDEEAAERERQEAEKAKALGPGSQPDPSKPTAPPSGATTPIAKRDKRPDTPSDREGKQKRKRPGSPYLSEAGGSGTDTSTRKKHKTSHDRDPLSRSESKLKIRGPGSDTDAGGVSDATRRIKKRHHHSKNSANVSRAGSPAAPTPAAAPQSTIDLNEVAPPAKMREIVLKSLENPEGLTMGEFLAKLGLSTFKDRNVLGKHIGPVVKVVSRPADGKKIVVLKEPAQTPAAH